MTWHTVCSVFIEGTPKPQPRHRVAKNGHMYYPPSADAWKDALALGLRPFVPTKPHEGPIRIDLDYFMPRPKRLMRKKDTDGIIPHTSKPDIDNLNKLVLDVMVKIGLITDDAQVYYIVAFKWYHRKSGEPGAHISLSVLVDE